MNEDVVGGRFVRDRLTWLGYLVSATPCYTLATFGPFMPFLQSEMHLSYTMAALHFTAWASGGLLAGCVGDRVLARVGHIKLMWLACFGIVIAISALILAHLPALTIASAAV